MTTFWKSFSVQPRRGRDLNTISPSRRVPAFAPSAVDISILMVLFGLIMVALACLGCSCWPARALHRFCAVTMVQYEYRHSTCLTYDITNFVCSGVINVVSVRPSVRPETIPYRTVAELWRISYSSTVRITRTSMSYIYVARYSTVPYRTSVNGAALLGMRTVQYIKPQV